MDRVHRWSADLKMRVEQESHGNQKAKMHWLIEHLGEYIQRWLGFSNIDQLTVKATFNNDAFCIIIGTLIVVDEQISKIEDKSWFPELEWEKFKNTLDFIQEYPNKENLTMVADGFNHLWDTFLRYGNALK